MIIGKNRRQVILNIKKSVKEKNFNAKVEPNDPILGKKERLNLVKNFWANHDKLFSRIINLIARGILNVGTPILTFNTKIDNSTSLKNLSSAIVTCNHYNQFDCLPLKRLAMKYHKRLYFVIEDTNLKLPSWIGFLMRNIDSIPVTASIEYLGRDFPRHLERILIRNNWIVIYPEQELWQNYRKPRPLQKGAYYYAAKMNVPIISCFVEIKDTKKREILHPEFNKTHWILHVLPTIYPNPKLSTSENAQKMQEIDYQQKKQAYEKAYHKKLNYKFTDWDIAGYNKK
ncbi:1-acyl-sn-glycerol-3-phosphate acyltransferase [Lactobacillus johnsonii]|uniref:1-acyl-sn-glycerol-3-phosphate acyltransferase n=1 Tax=Lactobacillus johnsonii TaxID=33959 RepID=A0A9X7Y5G0_LACJH|nr:1-acyl-sn-glycerol-3-phosphate acyltransferase [Lactobacillus johnsonii]QLL67380.1 1-acyl-sn-glycerol-3-phosphate acyltransferase [Lactobacillus johnsonii]